MVRRVLPTLLVVSVVVVVVVAGASSAQGQEYRSQHPHHDQQELTSSMVVNQLAILRLLNESSNSCSSGREQRPDTRTPVTDPAAVQTPNRVNELQRDRDELFARLEELTDHVSTGFQALREIKNDLQELRNTTLAAGRSSPGSGQHSGPAPGSSISDTLHNDTNPSLCGDYKVLYGTHGSLEVTQGYYRPNTRCLWHVRLPEGTRANLTWEYFDIEMCIGCVCDYVDIIEMLHNYPGKRLLCGTPFNRWSSEPGRDLDNTQGNDFIVMFHSNNRVQGRGFRLGYQAVPRQ